MKKGIIAQLRQAAPTLAGRIYLDTLPQTPAYPAAIVYWGISGSQDVTTDQRRDRTDRFQIVCAASQPDDLDIACAAIVSALDGFQGYLPNNDFSKLIRYLQPLSFPFDDSKKLYRAGSEFTVEYGF